MEARQTRASRDGGVDCVAYDPRPIMGGKVVIQAKRYRHTVGVSAVRDLFGTLQNEGASKGILVTTSGYGQASHDFARNKPIELLDGANLLYLLEEHAGIRARIEAPDSWSDPVPDRPDEATAAGPSRPVDPAPSEPAPPQTSVELAAGQNVSLTDSILEARLHCSRQQPVDLSALLLAADGRVAGDADFVFFNNPTALEGAVQLHADLSPAVCTINVSRLPDRVHRVVLVASSDVPFTRSDGLRLVAGQSNTLMTFSPSERAVLPALALVEIYRRNSQWRLRAVGQGYADGLAGLARDFGVDVD